MTAPDLKPCPFCGGGDVTTAVDHEQGSKWGYAGCDACGARGPEVRTGYDTAHDALWRAEAIAAWNTRATPAPAAMTPEVAKLVEAAKEYIDELEWHYGGGETDLGRKYRAALAALRAGGDA